MRPSPTESATTFPVGTVKMGNDGNHWVVRASARGVQRWVKVQNIAHPTYQTQYRFAIGDLVTVQHHGYGCSPTERGKEVVITSRGDYSGGPGYKVWPLIGNMLNIPGGGPGFIGEQSFAAAIDHNTRKYRNRTNDTLAGNLYHEFLQDSLNQATANTQANRVSSNGHHMSATTVTNPNGSQTWVDTTIDPNAPQTFKLNPNMSKVKTITKKTTQEVRQIETSLINKEEVFKMLALAEATGLPCLLIGQPGVAKTKTVIEYAKAWLNRDGKMSAQDFANKVYILETDEGTKASEIKGMPDLGKLFTDNKYELSAPIADAEIVVINEVDKASSAIRNAMLGVMNEKFLFNGKHKIPCKWKLFIATCNEIPKDEANSPFWDRFMLKHTVNRVSAGEIVKYFNKGARDYKEKFAIGVPNKQELSQVEVPVNKLEKYLEVGYAASSDRTLTFVPTLTKAVSYIWDISIDKSLVKTAQIMISQSAGSELQNKLMSPEVKAVMSKVEMLHSYKSNQQLELAIAEIEGLINTYATRGIMDKLQVEEIEVSMQYILQNHPARVEATDEELEELMMEADVDAMSASPVMQQASVSPF